MSQKNTLENFSVDQLEQMILELNRLKAQRLTEGARPAKTNLTI